MDARNAPVAFLVGAALLAAACRTGPRPAQVSPSPTEAPRSVPAGSRLFLAGDGELWVVEATTGTTRHVEAPHLSPGDPPHRIIRRNGALVAWGYRTLLLNPDRPTRPEVLAEDSWIFLPSSTGNRVWVGVLDPETGGARGLGAVREMTVEGRVTVPDVRPPGGRWPVAAVHEGLVFQAADGSALELWDPRSGEFLRRLPGLFPLAWAGHRLAWCDASCEEAHITDFSSGADRVIPLPRGIFHFQGYEGAFSPDGRFLALVGLTDPNFDRADYQLVLVDAETGDAEAIRRTVVQPSYNFLDWSPSGESVFLTGSDARERRQVVEYRPGEDEVRVLRVEGGNFYDMAVL
jgi:hypothetical protein